MNQEQNNLNQNSFNTQGNDGIPNNQTLNNQNINNNAYQNQGVQQNTNVSQQTFTSQPQPTPQPTNTFESGNANNLSFNSKPPRKMNLGLMIGIVAAVIIIGFGIFFGSKLLSKGNNSNSALNNDVETKEPDKDTNTDSTQSSNKKLVIYLNDLKITLGKTTMDEIIKNTDLEVIKDETNKYKGCTSNNISLSSDDWVEYDNRTIQLSDGINIFVITSYFEKTNIVGEITTLRNGKTDDPAFDNSKGTTLSFEDAVIGKRINLGDMYTDFEHEVYNNSSAGSCNKAGFNIYCYQSKHLSDDIFIYYLDDNQKVVNMTATLMSYYK